MASKSARRKTYMLKTWAPLICSVVLAAILLICPGLALLLMGGSGLAMAISFNDVPTNLRIPFVAAEIDNSLAASGPAELAYRGLIIGQKTAAGTATANTIVRVTNVNQALTYGGRGSMLHRMAIGWFAANKSTDVYLGVLADNGAGVLATKTVTFTGPATAAGTVNLYVGGVLTQTAVASGDTATTVAAAVAATITANLDLPVTAAPVAGVVTTTARNKGTVGQDLDLRVNYVDGEATPAGLTVVIANGVSGITNPSLTSLIAAMGDIWYNIIAHPYTDATSLTAIETELHSRFGPMRMIDGLAITSAPGTISTLGTLGLTRNSQHSCIVSQPGENPVTPPSEFAAEVAATLAYYGAIDPARPFQTLQLTNAKLPAEADLFTDAERNLLLYDGIGTTKFSAGGIVRIERVVTTYQTNSAGAPDTSFLDSNTMLNLMYLRYSFRVRIPSRYPRHKLADDGTRIASGQAIITPKLMKAECVAWFHEMEELGLVEGFEQFKRDLVVERNLTNRNRIDIVLPPDLINQLMTTAVKIQFHQ